MYTKRSLVSTPTTDDNTGYNINEFTYASYNKPMYGEIKIWSGPLASIPSGYCLADGRELSQTEYPNLYAVLGDTYNTQHKGNRYEYSSGSTNFYSCHFYRKR